MTIARFGSFRGLAASSRDFVGAAQLAPMTQAVQQSGTGLVAVANSISARPPMSAPMLPAIAYPVPSQSLPSWVLPAGIAAAALLVYLLTRSA